MTDAIERRILLLLGRNADLTSAQIGAEVGLSPSAAHRRVVQLRKRGLIKGYRATLSLAARGHPATVVINVTLRDQRQETMEAFEHAVVDYGEVRRCFLMSGDSDYILHIEVVRDDSFERVHREILAQLPGVARLGSHFVIRDVISRD